MDYLIDDAENLSVMPLEVKSGKDYTIHSALNKLTGMKDYPIKRACVLSNKQQVFKKEGVTYMPIYYVMFFDNNTEKAGDL